MTTINGTNIATMPAEEVQKIVDELKSWSVLKIIHLTVVLVSQTLGNSLLCGIVWYEEFGGMDQYKTVLNQLTAHLSAAIVIGRTTFVLFNNYPLKCNISY